MPRKLTTGLYVTGAALLAAVVLAFSGGGEALYSAPAAGAVYYISPTGLDTNPCTSLALACRSVQTAGTKLHAGDTLYMAGGVYSATASSLSPLGTVTQPITITSLPGEWAILDAASSPIPDTASVIRLLNPSYITLADFEIRNSSGRGISVYSGGNGTGHHVTIDGVIVRNVGQRAIGGSGDDIVIRDSLVEFAAMDNLGDGSGGGWAAGVSSYTQGNGDVSHRWTLVNTTIRNVRGECAIALDLRGFEWRGNRFENCYNVYIDKASDGLITGNVISQTLGWGKRGGVGDGFKLANENSNFPTTRFVLADIVMSANELLGVGDCFSYWQDTGNTNPTNTYARLTITGNTCSGNSGALADFHAVGSAYTQPTGNAWTANACTKCSVTFGDTNDRASWAIDTTPLPPTATATPTTGVSFAVVGDFGHEESGAADDVARLIAGWGVDFVTTVGDNTYYVTGQHDRGSGQFYHDWIYPYTGAYGLGSPTGANRFWPVLGNHDWDAGLTSYQAFFTLPGNERYYTFTVANVEFFMLDSDSRESDGNTYNSHQGVWLRNALAASTAEWKLVLLHHAPYSTGSTHGGSPTRRWPYAAWGADAVLAGHEHNYERVFAEGIVYFVNGLGGRSLYTFSQTPIPGSQVRYASDYGAMRVEAGATSIRFRFITRAGVVIDDYTLTAGAGVATPTPSATRTATRTPTRTATRTATRTRTATWTPSPSPSATPSSSPSPSPSVTPSLTASATSTPTPTPVEARNHYGVMLANWNSAGVDVANTLGAGLARLTIFTDRWDGTCAECDRAIAGGLKLVLTVRANGGAGVATVFPPDIAEYVLDVRSILEHYGPWVEVLVAENEENSSLFWASSVPQYHELLGMACAEAHAAGVKCANGGLVYSLTALLTWQGYMDAGATGSACSFAWRNFETDLAAQMCGTPPANTADYILEQVTKGRTLLARYKESGADVLNFHSYAPDYYSNVEMAAYLKSFGLPVMIGELGEREERPTNVVSELQACRDAGLVYCVWFSVDINQARALQNADGSLRPTGEVFREWVTQ